MQVPALAWALPQATKTTTRRSTFSFGGSTAGSGFGGTGGSFSTARHPFLPANYPIVAFLRDLAQIIPQAPVFARGIFVHIPMCLTSDTRIKSEQIFEHLIDSRQTYGFKVSSSLLFLIEENCRALFRLELSFESQMWKCKPDDRRQSALLVQ